MQVKLYDSELKIMGVLWREGDVTAKHISDVMKEIARSCIDQKVSASAAFGNVVSTAPLQVKVEERLLLDESILVLPRELQRRTQTVTIGGYTGEVVIYPGLKTGDKVLVLHLGDCWLLAGTLD